MAKTKESDDTFIQRLLESGEYSAEQLETIIASGKFNEMRRVLDRKSSMARALSETPGPEGRRVGQDRLFVSANPLEFLGAGAQQYKGNRQLEGYDKERQANEIQRAVELMGAYGGQGGQPGAAPGRPSRGPPPGYGADAAPAMGGDTTTPVAPMGDYNQQPIAPSGAPTPAPPPMPLPKPEMVYQNSPRADYAGERPPMDLPMGTPIPEGGGYNERSLTAGMPPWGGEQRKPSYMEDLSYLYKPGGPAIADALRKYVGEPAGEAVFDWNQRASQKLKDWSNWGG